MEKSRTNHNNTKKLEDFRNICIVGISEAFDQLKQLE